MIWSGAKPAAAGRDSRCRRGHRWFTVVEHVSGCVTRPAWHSASAWLVEFACTAPRPVPAWGRWSVWRSSGTWPTTNGAWASWAIRPSSTPAPTSTSSTAQPAVKGLVDQLHEHGVEHVEHDAH